MITEAPYNFIGTEGTLSGTNLIHSEKRIAQLKNIFADEAARSAMDQNTLVYSVQAILPVEQGTEAGLFFGTTTIEPGTVNEEYFITQGHFHKLSNRAEYYWGIKGEGALILMDRHRNYRAELMHPGSLHYIPAHTAHRVANTGNTQLVFSACWPSDAGYDYEEIIKYGFSCRLLNRNDKPELVKL
ncbi:MAG TPA: glucose-6-phosphate isomerase family protein [Panacibacter sp.]|nr:glucose-6-phosphate isomerase family protein [Panacibacter sp.]